MPVRPDARVRDDASREREPRARALARLAIRTASDRSDAGAIRAAGVVAVEIAGEAGAGAASTIAAAVAAVLARSDSEDVVTNAIGLAASSASANGADTHTDIAADAGTHAAALALAGWDAPPTALEGRKGLYAVLAPGQPESSQDWGGLVSELAAGVAAFTWDDLDENVRDAARDTFGNAAALALAASVEPAIRAAAASLTGPAADGLALGFADPLPAEAAAFVHGSAAHLEDFDDTHLASVVHPGAPIAGAVLAAAQRTNASGADGLAAMVAGVEIALRLGEQLPEALARGWHITGLVGPIGAAVAVARLAGSGVAGIAAAIDAAADRASGITEALGTLAKPMHVGNAARTGVRIGSGPAVPGAGGGLARLLRSVAATPSLATSGFRILDNVVKPYACGVLGHSSIELALWLRERTAGRGFDRCELRVSPLAIMAMGRLDPTDGLESKFSIVHAFAVAYLYGDADPARFSDEEAVDPRVRELRDRVRLSTDEAGGRYAATVT
ncbi:MAG TPA: MmgE/PrpD family protein, partial [Solirubrobacteraceae bacterium]|nr:MmgE/PrpD family protein [Solirubrobacteraceae bacterium]